MVLVLTVTMFATLPIASSRTMDIYAFVALAPNPTGLGQGTVLMGWVSMPTPTVMGQEVGERWENITITVTKPNGDVETLGPFEADPVGFVAMFYTPDQLGTYTFQTHFPGQTLLSGNYYTAADSAIVKLVVQEDQVLAEEGVPFTDDYWERPIYGENRDWWPKTGNWLMAAYDTTFRFFDQGSAFGPYSDAPDSPHIMWTRPITDGGIIGGKYSSTAYYTGLSYEMKLSPPLIINGRYYYNLFPADQGLGYAVLDLRTGEELWRNEEVWIDIGQIYDYESPNQHGGQTYLWSLGDTYKMYDAFTGDFILEIENVTGGTARFSDVGDLLTYTIGGGNITLWKSSKCIPPLGEPGTTEGDQWRPWVAGQSGPLDWKDGIEWSVPIPAHPGLPGIQAAITDPDVIVAYYFQNDFAVSFYSGLGWFLDVGYSATTGEELWVQNRTMQSATQFIWQMLDYSNTGDKEADIYTYHARDQLRSYGFNINTGEQVWVTDPLESGWAMFPSGQITAYGKYYICTYDGKVHAYNVDDGSFAWEYFGGNAGVDTPYGHFPYYSGILIADDKIFASNGEHSPSTPLWRGYKLHVIDAHTGEGLWNISGWFISHGNIVADGYFVGLNGYDNQLYCFGKGQSATTVTASQKVIAKGDTVLIEGTVTDQSVGQPDTPCVSKESMSAWMEYLHMQQLLPMDATGVPVKLEAFGSDGSYIDIGTVTSELTGFMYEWTPPDEGLYTILATFYGDDSYGSSYAGTGLSVGSAPTPAEPIEPEEPAEAPFITTEIAIIAAVAVAVIVGIVAYWALRKRRQK